MPSVRFFNTPGLIPFVLALMVFACSETPSAGSNDEGECSDGATRTCQCVDGSEGVQACRFTAPFYGECECAVSGEDVTNSGNPDVIGDAGSSVPEDHHVVLECDPPCQLEDACNEALCVDGVCVSQPVNGVCDDGDLCTLEDQCKDGLCAGVVDESCVYAVEPDLAACVAGEISQWRKIRAMDAVNSVRALHGLKAVGYRDEGDLQTQRAALMMAANSALSHQPPEDWLCWSQDGFEGASTSNLHIGWNTAASEPADPSSAVVGFLIDGGVESLGHRRWVLDPFLKYISFGSVHGQQTINPEFPFVYAAVLQVIHEEEAEISPENTPQGIGYPVGDYPRAYFNKNWYLSFSAVVDFSTAGPNDAVDVSNASIQMSGPAGEAVEVYDLRGNNDFFGVPNHLQWKAKDLQDDVLYKVDVGGLKVGGEPLEYSYEFRLVE